MSSATPKRPLIFLFQGLLGRILGFKRFRRLAALVDIVLFRLTPMRFVLAANYKRIRAFQAPAGGPPIRSNVSKHLSRLARNFADNQAALAALARSLDDPILDKANLHLLPEIQRLLSGGRGVILGSAHFGNLWVACEALARTPLPLTCVILNGRPYRWLETPSLRILGLEEAARPCLQALRRNECVLIFGDMDLYWRGHPRPDLFGAPYPAPRALIRLALLSGAPILPSFAVSCGETVHFECDSAIDPRGKSAGEIGALFFRSMERWIGRHPEQWFLLKDAWNAKAVARAGRRQIRAARSYNKFFSGRK